MAEETKDQADVEAKDDGQAQDVEKLIAQAKAEGFREAEEKYKPEIRGLNQKASELHRRIEETDKGKMSAEEQIAELRKMFQEKESEVAKERLVNQLSSAAAEMGISFTKHFPVRLITPDYTLEEGMGLLNSIAREREDLKKEMRNSDMIENGHKPGAGAAKDNELPKGVDQLTQGAKAIYSSGRLDHMNR